MSLPMLGWLFAFGVVVHNVEEAWLMPGWQKGSARWRAKVSPWAFRFGTVVLSIAVLLAAWLAEAGGPLSFGANFLAGFALAMVLNVFVPHVAASIAWRSYAPGTLTALLLNLPLGSWLVYRSFAEGAVTTSTFAIDGTLTVVGLMMSIPVLFALGNKLWGATR